MSIRDWIPRFAALPARGLADLEADNARLLAANAELARQLDVVSRERDDERNRHMITSDGWCELHNTLRIIADLGAASRNGTARKMARMAREALE